MSCDVIEPKSLPSSPALPRRVTVMAPSWAASCSAAAFSALAFDRACPGLGIDALLVALGRLEGEAARQQEVPGVAGLHPHELAGLAEGLHVFPQDHFHHHLVPPVVGAIRRRKSSHVSASPRRVRPLATKANMRTVSTV